MRESAQLFGVHYSTLQRFINKTSGNTVKNNTHVGYAKPRQVFTSEQEEELVSTAVEPIPSTSTTVEPLPSTSTTIETLLSISTAVETQPSLITDEAKTTNVGESSLCAEKIAPHPKATPRKKKTVQAGKLVKVPY